MLSFTNKPLMLSVIMLNVVVLSVDMLSVVAQICYHLNFVSTSVTKQKRFIVLMTERENYDEMFGAKQVLKCIKKNFCSRICLNLEKIEH